MVGEQVVRHGERSIYTVNKNIQLPTDHDDVQVCLLSV